MENLYHFFLKVLRRIYRKYHKKNSVTWEYEKNPDKASLLIYNKLQSGEPCMIARFGSTELNTIINYLGTLTKTHSAIKFIKGEQTEWWWNKKSMIQMQKWSGFFPTTEANLNKFSQLMLNDIKEVDILGSWCKEENCFQHLMPHVQKIRLLLLEPYWSKQPWTKALKGKRIVVVHPFKQSIIQQYTTKRTLLFENPDVLPEFASLRVVKAVQSLNGNSQFNDWFDALEYMKKEIDKEDYDVCLIGCGAYGFPLAAHVKRQKKQAIHIGGALQLLFGIRGKRWENPNYGSTLPGANYQKLMNEHWTRPLPEETPPTASNVENSCYW